MENKEPLYNILLSHRLKIIDTTEAIRRIKQYYKKSEIINYESFQNQSNKLGNLYIVVRKSDNKEIIRGANYSKVIDIIRKDTHLYEIYFY